MLRFLLSAESMGRIGLAALAAPFIRGASPSPMRIKSMRGATLEERGEESPSGLVGYPTRPLGLRELSA
jgi:hypothetical protein